MHPRLQQVIAAVGAIWSALMVLGGARTSRWLVVAIFAVVLAVLLFSVLAAPVRWRRTQQMTAYVGDRRRPEERPSLPQARGWIRDYKAGEDPHVRRLLRLRLLGAVGAAALFTFVCVLAT